MLQEAMEAIRRLEQGWTQSPHEAIILLVCVATVVVGLCATAVARRKRAHKKQLVEEASVDLTNKSSWGAIKRVLMSTVRWSARNEWGVTENVNLDRMPALLGRVGEVDWGERSSPISSLWQRRILMGERCELPRFSGLILYDERGRPLGHHKEKVIGHPLGHQKEKATHQEKRATAVTTTLRDLL